MTFDAAGVLRDAWRMWKHDHDLLLRIAGVLLFFPQLLVFWLTPPLTPQPTFPGFDVSEDQARAYTEAAQQWFLTYGLGSFLVAIVSLYGALTLTMLYLGKDKPDAQGALTSGLIRLPKFLVLALIISTPLSIAVEVAPLLILPVIYIVGRWLTVIPVFVAERPVSIVGSIRRGMKLTRGHGLVLAGLACIVTFAGFFVSLPFALLGTLSDGAPMNNPAIAFFLDAARAAALAGGAVAAVLIQVATYRRLRAAANNGI